MSQQELPDPLNIRITQESDKNLFRMVRRELAESQECKPEELGYVEVVRQCFVYRIDNPAGVNITLNGESETLIRALNQSDSAGTDALEDIAKDAMKLRQREAATAGGAKYTGDSG